MSLGAKEQCLAQEMIDLKTRVKAEMSRRCRNGSLTTYAGDDYDYTVTPTTGEQMLTEHVNKIVTPMNAITTQPVTERAIGDQAVAMDIIDANLTAYEAEAMRGSSSCSGACSGLCTSGCWNSCSGCGTACSSGCSSGCDADGCTKSCSSNCGSCNGSCSGGCDTTCNDKCDTTCTKACADNCSDTCENGCRTGCYTTCTGKCGSQCQQLCASSG